MSIQIIHRPYKSNASVVFELKTVGSRNVIKAFREMSERFKSETISLGNVGRGSMWIEINGEPVDVVCENTMYYLMTDRNYQKMSGETATEFAKKLIEERT